MTAAMTLEAGAAVTAVVVDAPTPALTLEQLTERVARTNTLVLSQLHETQQKRVDGEEARGVRLETKAAGLIGVNALTLTLVSSVGIGVLLRGGAALGLWLIPALALYLASVFFGLRTGWLALEAVKVRDHHKLKTDDIFPDDILAQADAVANHEGGADRENDGLGIYHRFSIVCLEKLLRNDALVNDEKAARLENAQRAFQRFLVTIGLLALTSALVAVFGAISG